MPLRIVRDGRGGGGGGGGGRMVEGRGVEVDGAVLGDGVELGLGAAYGRDIALAAFWNRRP